MATTTEKYIYTEILKKAAKQRVIPNKSQEARDWFRRKAQGYRNVSREDLFKGATVTNTPMPGRMYMYVYDAKTKDKLPYWDAFPLIFHVKSDKDGFYGINMHYLEPVLRAKLMDALYMITNNKKFDDTTALNISYKLLNSMSSLQYFRPCFKKYLRSHLKSQMIYVEPKEWDVALFLPLQRFQKASDQQVWADSYQAAQNTKPSKRKK
jgi:hypothetical protein